MTPALPSVSRQRSIPTPQRTSSKDIALVYDQEVSALSNRPRSRDKALLVAAQDYPEESSLLTPHSDQKTLKDYLVKKGFNAASIRCLNETDNNPQLHPTKKNIENAFDWLIEGVSAGDVVVLHLAGHATQVENKTGSELDGKDEAYMTIDVPRPGKHDNLILDNTIREKVVNRLPPGSFLVAISDTCHSGTMLDLDSKRYTPNIPAMNNVGASSVDIPRCQSPKPQDRYGDSAFVISISACCDDQEAWGSSETMLQVPCTMLQHLLRILDSHATKPLTPRELERQLDERLYNARKDTVEKIYQKKNKSMKPGREDEIRKQQKPVISTLPVHKEIMDRPFSILTQARPTPSTTIRVARQRSQGSGTR